MIRQATMASALLAGLVLGGPVRAEEGTCPKYASDQVMSKDQLADRLKTMGYDVRGIQVRDGCWEVKGFDKDGKRVEVHVDPVTAEIKQDED